MGAISGDRWLMIMSVSSVVPYSLSLKGVIGFFLGVLTGGLLCGRGAVFLKLYFPLVPVVLIALINGGWSIVIINWIVLL